MKFGLFNFLIMESTWPLHPMIAPPSYGRYYAVVIILALDDLSYINGFFS